MFLKAVVEMIEYLNCKNNESKKISEFLNYNKQFKDNQFYINKHKDSENDFTVSFIKEKFNENKMSNNRKERNVSVINRNVFVGLKNLGATCFMNAVLQILNNIEPLSDYLYNEEYKNNKNKNYPITNALATVIKNLRNSKESTYSPIEFKNVIGHYNPEFLNNEPNDSKKLIQYLLNTLHKELNKNSSKHYPNEDEYEDTQWKEKLEFEKESFKYENNSIISDLFYGIQATETYCYNCNEISYSFEHFNIISLPIIRFKNGRINIEDMFEDYSRKIELTGRNKNYCSICEKDYDGYCYNMFYETPKIFIIHPSRKSKGIKYNIPIEFEDTINIKIKKNGEIKTVFYNLIGLIYHFGTNGYGGHNIAYCKRHKEWYEFNDSKIPKKINIKTISGEGALLFIYQNKI